MLNNEVRRLYSTTCFNIEISEMAKYEPPAGVGGDSPANFERTGGVQTKEDK